MVVVDGIRNARQRGWENRDRFIALIDFNGPNDFQKRPMAVLSDNSSVQDHFDKGCCAPIHDGELGGIHLDIQIVDA